MSVESGGGRAQRGHDGQSRDHRSKHDQSAARGRAETLTELERLLTPAIAEAGFDLEEVDVRPAGRRRLVRIVVDADGGVSLDDIALLSQTASELLDAAEVMGTGPYVLEVTSPGVDRPLTEPRHWRRAKGRLVVAPLTAGGQIEGRVVEADDEAVVIDVTAKGGHKGAKGSKGSKGTPKGSKGPGKGGPAEPTKTTRRRFALEELGRGRVQVEFRPADDPGKGPGGPGAKRGARAATGEAAETRSPAEPE
jgi:ribosome maturation factor RimP